MLFFLGNSKQQWIFIENSMLFYIYAAFLCVQRNFLYILLKCAFLKLQIAKIMMACIPTPFFVKIDYSWGEYILGWVVLNKTMLINYWYSISLTVPFRIYIKNTKGKEWISLDVMEYRFSTRKKINWKSYSWQFYSFFSLRFEITKIAKSNINKIIRKLLPLHLTAFRPRR